VRETVHSKAIRLAAEALGGMAQLQHALRVPSQDLLRWMNGVEAPPQQVFLRVVDILLDPPGA
jgi:hypothetical protein